MASLSSQSDQKETQQLKELLRQRPRIKKNTPQQSNNLVWNNEELNKLERFISILGTDFDLIKLFFKNKTRKQIMNKYKKEKIKYNRKHKDRFQRIQAELEQNHPLERTRLGSIDSIDLNIAQDIHKFTKIKQ